MHRGAQYALRRTIAALVPTLALPVAAFAQCPGADQVGASLEKTFKQQIEVKKVSPSPVKGLCEVQVRFRGRANVLYTDATGAYFVTGHIIDAAGGKDLTEETLAALNAFTPEDMKRLETLTALTVGSKGKAVYFVTDPQ